MTYKETLERELTYRCCGQGVGAVKRLQEWLCHHGHHTAVDGDYGPATAQALADFEGTIEPVNSLDRTTWILLTLPMRNAAGAVPPPAAQKHVEWTPGLQRIVRMTGTHENKTYMLACYFAGLHLMAGAHEIGGPNMGPWVRLYMRGKQGRSWPWCAGFVSFVLHQAFDGAPPIDSFSCDQLADQAASRAALRIRTRKHVAKHGVPPGSVFLLHKGNDCYHTGFVTSAHKDFYTTIEGNTNMQGHREGVAVLARTRSYSTPVKFIVFGD